MGEGLRVRERNSGRRRGRRWQAGGLRLYRVDRAYIELGRHVHHDDSKQHGRSLNPLLADVLDARGVGPPGEGEG